VELCSREGDEEVLACPGSGFRCVESAGAAKVCPPFCDLLSLGAGCPDARLCTALDTYAWTFPLGDTATAACTPDAGAGASYGYGCDGQLGCVPGLHCVPAEHVPDCDEPGTFGCCTDYCDLGAPACPHPDTPSCIPLFQPGAAPDELAHVGVCSGAE
jgi:hypothetical protein